MVYLFLLIDAKKIIERKSLKRLQLPEDLKNVVLLTIIFYMKAIGRARPTLTQLTLFKVEQQRIVNKLVCLGENLTEPFFAILYKK